MVLLRLFGRSGKGSLAEASGTFSEASRYPLAGLGKHARLGNHARARVDERAGANGVAST